MVEVVGGVLRCRLSVVEDQSTMWHAEYHALALDLGYSSSSKRSRPARHHSDAATDEALDLMEINDFSTLNKRRAQHIKGVLSWAKLAEVATNGVLRELLSCSSDDDLHKAAQRATELRARLDVRDSVRGARTTNDARHQIHLVESVANTMRELKAVRDNKTTASYDTANRLLALRSKWSRLLPNDPMVDRDNAFVRSLVQNASASVLGAGSVSDGVKALYAKAVTQWTPSPPAGQSRSHSPSDQSSHSESGGTRISWDSDDDEW